MWPPLKLLKIDQCVKYLSFIMFVKEIILFCIDAHKVSCQRYKWYFDGVWIDVL